MKNIEILIILLFPLVALGSCSNERRKVDNTDMSSLSLNANNLNHDLIDSFPKVRPINKFLRMLWEIELNEERNMPLVMDKVVFLPNSQIIDGLTGKSISYTQYLTNYQGSEYDSILVIDNYDKVRIFNLKNNSVINERRLLRNNFLERNGIQLMRDSVYVTVFGKNLIKAINIRNGEILWGFNSKSDIYNKPLVTDSKVYVANKFDLLEFDKITGHLNSQFKVGNFFDSRLNIDNGILYVFINGRGLEAIDIKNGSTIWTKPFEKSSKYLYDVEDDPYNIYFGHLSLYSVSKKSGEENWKLYTLGGAVVDRTNVLALVENYLIFYKYVGGEYMLTVVDKNSGTELFEGLNSSILNHKRTTFSEPPGEDLQFIDFVNNLIDNRVLIGKMGTKLYGFEILK